MDGDRIIIECNNKGQRIMVMYKLNSISVYLASRSPLVYRTTAGSNLYNRATKALELNSNRW